MLFSVEKLQLLPLTSLDGITIDSDSDKVD